LDLDALLLLLREWRGAGERVGLANGAFDLFHVGHLRYLLAAAQLADRLVVAVNADRSVQMSKGKGRPLIPEQERAEIVAGLRGVDAVILFAEREVSTLIEALRPDLQIKGTDYTPETVPERELVRRYGGEVVIAGDPKDHATTDLVARLRGLSDAE